MPTRHPDAARVAASASAAAAAFARMPGTIALVFNDPRMTSNGRRIAFLVAILAACALPKRVERGRHPGRWKGETCVVYELEPLAVYGIESALSTRLGVVYSRDDCGR